MAGTLPPSLADALRPVLPELAGEIISAIGQEVPDYARPLEGPFGKALHVGVRTALTRFVDGIENGGANGAESRELYVELGRVEFRGGRSLDALLSAYRIGARLAWERFVAAGEAAGHEPATLYRLASAIFSYIDGISADSVEGYAEERAATEGERQRRRRALARLLARDGIDPEEIHDLAGLAGWSRPATVGALVIAADDDLDPDRLASRLGGDTIATGPEDGTALAWVPDPEAPGRRPQLEAALDGASAALGPAVTLTRAPQSLARARAAHALVLAGRLPAGTLVVADEHLSELLLHGGGDSSLAADLAARVLAPLADLRTTARRRLQETLRAWLDHPGQIQPVAERLHVHPQTVRYRLAQLRELFGDRLDDPDQRFDLALALRSGGAEEDDEDSGRAGAGS